MEKSVLEGKVASELHTIAASLGIDGHQKLKKAELVDALLELAVPRGQLGRAAVDSNEIFIDGLEIPDENVVGEPGDGWRVAMSTAGNERGLSLRSPGRFCAAADRLAVLGPQHLEGDEAVTGRDQ